MHRYILPYFIFHVFFLIIALTIFLKWKLFQYKTELERYQEHLSLLTIS